MDAQSQIDFINERLNLNLPEGEYETVAGLVIEQMEKIPQSGDQVQIGNYRLTVKETGKRKTHSIIVRKMKNDDVAPETRSE